ncbi:MAG: PadR family transcriptional regulator [Luteibaculum sp.]
MLLSLLDEQGRMYGYEITQIVKQRSNGEIVLTEGALYPSLHKLEATGLVETSKEKTNGRVRKYYSLTDKGKREAAKAKAGWSNFSAQMHNILKTMQYA